jgi:hypothetical protein
VRIRDLDSHGLGAIITICSWVKRMAGVEPIGISFTSFGLQRANLPASLAQLTLIDLLDWSEVRWVVDMSVVDGIGGRVRRDIWARILWCLSGCLIVHVMHPSMPSERNERQRERGRQRETERETERE